MSSAHKPKNPVSAFDNPPAASTRSSSAELFVSPSWRTKLKQSTQRLAAKLDSPLLARSTGAGATPTQASITDLTTNLAESDDEVFVKYRPASARTRTNLSPQSVKFQLPIPQRDDLPAPTENPVDPAVGDTTTDQATEAADDGTDTLSVANTINTGADTASETGDQDTTDTGTSTMADADQATGGDPTLQTQQTTTTAQQPTSDDVQPTAPAPSNAPTSGQPSAAGAAPAPAVVTTSQPNSQPNSGAAATVTTTTATTTSAGRNDTTSVFCPPKFSGDVNDDVEAWLSRFNRYAVYRQLNDADKRNVFVLMLKGQAEAWLDSLPPNTIESWQQLKTAFENRFKQSALQKYKRAADLWKRVQAEDESVDNFITAMCKLGKAAGVGDEQLLFSIQHGFRPQILGHVIQRQPSNLDELLAAARLAECAENATAEARPNTMNLILAEIAASRAEAVRYKNELRDLVTKPVEKNEISNVQRIPVEQRPQQLQQQQRNVFVGRTQRGNQFPRPQRQQWRMQGTVINQRYASPMQYTSTGQASKQCGYCGGQHVPGPAYCRAANLQCYFCSRYGHIQRFCRAARRAGSYVPPQFPTPQQGQNPNMQ